MHDRFPQLSEYYSNMRLESKVFCFRVLSVGCLCLSMVLGAAILGLSVWFGLDEWIKTYFIAQPELHITLIFIYLFIAGGGFIILFGIIGIVGAAKSRRTCLILCLTFLLLSFLLTVGAIVYRFINRVKIEESVQVAPLITGTLQRMYGKDEGFDKGFDSIQIEMRCCGGDGFQDYKDSYWATVDYDKLTGTKISRKNKVPLSCCGIVMSSYSTGDQYCNMYENAQQSQPSADVFKRGCGDAFVEYFKVKINIICIVAICMILVLAFTVVAVSLLIRFLRLVAEPYTTDDVVYEMARTQEKSAYPARGQGGSYPNY